MKVFYYFLGLDVITPQTNNTEKSQQEKGYVHQKERIKK
jgi:hypothetical protein